MADSGTLFLDFSKPDAALEINELLRQSKPLDPHIHSLHFCHSWLHGAMQFEFKSSGSTGRPKSQLVSKERIVASVEGTAHFFSLKKGDYVLMCLAAEFTGGKMMLARALHLGLKIRLVPPTGLPTKWLPQDCDRFDLVSLVPYQLASLLKEDKAYFLTEKCKSILVGGAQVSKDLENRIKAIGHPNIFESFGMTETLSHFALRNIGNPSPYFQVLPGIEIATDDRGCLLVKGAVTNHEWITTSDIVDLHDNQHFAWKGRLDYVINSGGIKIHPEQIEEQLYPFLTGHGYLGDYMVTGKKDNELGMRSVLVVTKAIENHDLFLSALKSIFPKHHAPKEIVVVPSIPKTTSGKIKRSFLND